MRERVVALARRTVPMPLLRALWRLTCWPPVGQVRFGSLRRTSPVSRHFGADRGQPVDRWFIERFLDAHRADVKGRVLEIADDAYTRRFGGDRVAQADILHAVAGNPKATLVGDLSDAPHLPADAFDCVILTQTLQFIPRPERALATIHRILKPGGVLLATVPGISQISRYDMDRWGDYWRFTDRSLRMLLDERFGPGRAAVEHHGNVLVATSLLHGLSSTELKEQELLEKDPDYQVLLTARAVKG